MTNVTRNNRSLLNLCIGCGAARDSDAKNCIACTAKTNAYLATRPFTTKNRRDAEGVCVSCGAERDTVAKNCQVCIRKELEAQKRRAARGHLTTRERRQQAGTCVDCGGARDPSAARCVPCQSKQVGYKQQRKGLLKRIEGTLCTNCDRPRDQETKLCSACTSSATRASKEWRAKRRETGTQCMYCIEPRWHASSSCRWHFVEKILNNFNIGPRYSGQVAEMLEASNFTCFYTGVPLVPGENASLDHVLPRSKYPHLTDCLENLVWCDRTFNNLKTNYETAELMNACRELLKREEKVAAKTLSISSLPLPATIPVPDPYILPPITES